MTPTITLDAPLSAAGIAAVADGADLVLSAAARERIVRARFIVEALVEQGIRGYGINTGVGALSDIVIDRGLQRALSRNIVFSHACGIGAPLGRRETRAVMAAQIANFAHGASGVRIEIVETLLALLCADLLPVIPSRGSVGYLTHAAAIALVLLGHGAVLARDKRMTGTEALAAVGRTALVLEAKEGLSLVNGTPCATGLGALAVSRARHLFAWADVAAAMAYENLGAQADAFAAETLSLRRSQGLADVGATLRDLLSGSPRLAETTGRRTQDPLSLRAIPQIHGAARDALTDVAAVVERELASVTDNPAVAGTPEAPRILSQAHAVAAALGLSLDALGVAVAQMAAISERRIDRLVNPLVSGLPAFLAVSDGVASGYMIAQYTAAALVAENRGLAAPASLGGGITSALQEDILTHATPAATKALALLDNLRDVLAIELLAAAQAYDLQPEERRAAPRMQAVRRRIRALAPLYADDRPMNEDIAAVAAFLEVTEAGDATRSAGERDAPSA
ncbi:histidine ammonia-lyase [Aureimonas sp. Leaf454]|uniref:HAL/PAL/TAL family ammonia-lyase n=1 Tax=Aureimonas sp. Leaf454 TaxID=1736381 RepID=UPI0006FC1812|nr:histidine ammonia-lyase [Aureimonas sp. Leaf454]KQT54538.1 histidine ammonia-lyase [Aureimonas sp. Leaf454]